MAVLLSFLGIGRKNENPDAPDVYKRIHHVLGSEKESCETALSVYALLQKFRERISHVVIIGTHTSSWSALLEEIPEECSDLFVRVEEEIAQKHVDDASLRAIEEILSRNWNTAVSCISHTAQIDSLTMEEMHQLYQKVVFSFPEDTEEIVFDVTHGFRSMPLLMMTALEFRGILFPARTKLHVLYVELQGHQAVVREITPIYEQTEKNHAVRLFLDSFEGEPLASYVEDFWPKGARIIRRFSSIIHGNSVNDLYHFINKQLADTLKSGGNEVFPFWFKPVFTWMESLHSELQNDRRSVLTASVADLLMRKHMYGQAFMALHAAFQVYVHEYYQQVDSFGDWEHFIVLRDEFYQAPSAASPQDKKKLKTLEVTRNAIAHGGTGNYGKQFHAENLPYTFKSCAETLKKILSLSCAESNMST